MTYIHTVEFILQNLLFPLNKSISCTVTPKNIIYLISEDNMLNFKVSENYFYFEGNAQLDNGQTPHSPVTINLPNTRQKLGF